MTKEESLYDARFPVCNSIPSAPQTRVRTTRPPPSPSMSRRLATWLASTMKPCPPTRCVGFGFKAHDVSLHRQHKHSTKRARRRGVGPDGGGGAAPRASPARRMWLVGLCLCRRRLWLGSDQCRAGPGLAGPTATLPSPWSTDHLDLSYSCRGVAVPIPSSMTQSMHARNEPPTHRSLLPLLGLLLTNFNAPHRALAQEGGLLVLLWSIRDVFGGEVATLFGHSGHAGAGF